MKKTLPKAAKHLLSQQPVYLGNNRAITRTIYGHKILLDTRDMSLTPHILMDGKWEEWITNVFLSLIREGDTVIDIGCNIGYYSLLAAGAVGENGKVICYEANKELADLAFHSLHMNGFHDRTDVRNKAIYSKNTTITFSMFEKFKGSSGIWVTDELARSYHDKLIKINIEAATLDSEIPAGTKVDLLKIDTEGAEPHIIEGAKRVLQENEEIKIIMEFCPMMIDASFGSTNRFYEILKEMGFSLFRIKTDSRLEEITKENLSAINHCDVVAKRV